MINKTKKVENQIRRAARSRYKLKLHGTRPRLVFSKSNRYLTAQIIDDNQGRTLVYATTREKDFPQHENSKKSKSAAIELGKVIANRAKEKGITKVMLDRSGMIYHGVLAAFADSAREQGLEF